MRTIKAKFDKKGNFLLMCIFRNPTLLIHCFNDIYMYIT